MTYDALLFIELKGIMFQVLSWDSIIGNLLDVDLSPFPMKIFIKKSIKFWQNKVNCSLPKNE